MPNITINTDKEFFEQIDIIEKFMRSDNHVLFENIESELSAKHSIRTAICYERKELIELLSCNEIDKCLDIIYNYDAYYTQHVGEYNIAFLTQQIDYMMIFIYDEFDDSLKQRVQAACEYLCLRGARELGYNFSHIIWETRDRVLTKIMMAIFEEEGMI